MGNTTIRERIERWLERREMTQRELAVQLGISEAHLSQILSEQRRPSLDVAVQLEELTGLPVKVFARVA